MPQNPSSSPRRKPNPRRVRAGRLNRQKRGPLTPEGREQLRQAAILNEPWQHAAGPRTWFGKNQARINGKRRQKGELSGRQVRAELSEFEKMRSDIKSLLNTIQSRPDAG